MGKKNCKEMQRTSSSIDVRRPMIYILLVIFECIQYIYIRVRFEYLSRSLYVWTEKTTSGRGKKEKKNLECHSASMVYNIITCPRYLINIFVKNIPFVEENVNFVASYLKKKK